MCISDEINEKYKEEYECNNVPKKVEEGLELP